MPLDVDESEDFLEVGSVWIGDGVGCADLTPGGPGESFTLDSRQDGRTGLWTDDRALRREEFEAVVFGRVVRG